MYTSMIDDLKKELDNCKHMDCRTNDDKDNLCDVCHIREAVIKDLIFLKGIKDIDKQIGL